MPLGNLISDYYSSIISDDQHDRKHFVNDDFIAFGVFVHVQGVFCRVVHHLCCETYPYSYFLFSRVTNILKKKIKSTVFLDSF